MTISSKNLTFQSNDSLNEDNLRKLIRLFANDADGYINRGLQVTADHVNNNIDVGNGAAIIVDDSGEGAYSAEHPGLTGASMATTSGVNYVFVSIDPTNGEDVTVEINTSDAPDRTPALKIAEVDTLNDTPAEMFNDHPTGSFGDLTTLSSFTDAGGVEHTGALSDVGHDHAGEDLGSSSPVSSITTDEFTIQNRVKTAQPGDDLVSIVNNLAAGTELIVYGVHTIDSQLNPPDNTTLTVEGKITLSDGTADHIIHRIDPIGVTIRGNGTLNGNKSTLTDDGANDQSVGIHLRGYPEDIVIRDIEVMDTKNAAMAIGGGDGGAGRFSNLLMQNVYAHDAGLASTTGDICFLQGDDMRIEGCEFVNCRDTHITPGNCTNFTITGCIAYNTDSYNTNVGGAFQVVALGTQGGDCLGTISGNVFGNPGSGNNTIDQYSDTNMRGVTITGNYLFGSCNNGMHLSNSREVTVSGNFVIGPSNHGILIGDGKVIGNVVRDTGAVGIYTENGGLHAEVIGNTVLATGDDGIGAYGGASKVISNRVINTGGHGIRLGNSKADHCALNNHVAACTNNGINVGDSVTNSRISNNRCVNNSYGINTAGTGDYNLYLGNILRGNTNSGIGGTLGANSVSQANIT